jgi:malate dehydrogenase (oxaloacetate-decarboxylating)(NADP+)
MSSALVVFAVFSYLYMQGLVVTSRQDLQPHKVAFAQDCKPQRHLTEAIQCIQPTALIGVSTVAAAFTEAAVDAMSSCNNRPIIFPLSNPTHLSECTFEDVMRWTRGKALFASGSPFPPTLVEGVMLRPSQANNAYVFPAIGHAAILARARCIPDSAFLVAAAELALSTSKNDIDAGQLFPSLNDILPASKRIMLAVCQHFEASGIGSKPNELSWQELVDNAIWRPEFVSKL